MGAGADGVRSRWEEVEVEMGVGRGGGVRVTLHFRCFWRSDDGEMSFVPCDAQLAVSLLLVFPVVFRVVFPVFILTCCFTVFNALSHCYCKLFSW